MPGVGRPSWMSISVHKRAVPFSTMNRVLQRDCAASKMCVRGRMRIEISSTINHGFSLVLLLFAATSAYSAALPKIRILATGGTIAGVQSQEGSAEYQSGAVSAEDLLKAIPQVKGIAEISAEQVSNIGSQNMTNAVWLKLASRLNEVLNDSNVDGVVVTHGTDTMEETAYFLSLVAKSDKPVVMVGAMRPATAVSADGPMNLLNGIAVAADPNAKGRGVLVVDDSDIHFAREIEKTNTARVDSFESTNRGRAGMIVDGKPVFFAPPTLKLGLRSEFSVNGLSELPRVEIVYSYANFGRDVIDYLVSQRAKGIVLAGVGDGNTTGEALEGLRDAAKKGVVIVRSSRVGSGPTRRNVEINDDQLGFVVSGELNPQKARVLLMLGLARTTDPKKLQQYFYEY